MFSKNSKGYSADKKLWELTQVEPQFADPEQDLNEETSAANVANDSQLLESVADPHLHETISGIKRPKRNLDDFELAPRYAGKKVSRRKLEEEEEEDQSDQYSDSDESDGAHEAKGSDDDEESAASDVQSDEEDDDGDDTEEDDEDQESHDVPNKQDRLPSDIPLMIQSTAAPQDSSKGLAVKNQLSVWDSLLDVRIKIQKLLQSSNKLPQAGVSETFLSDPAYKKSVDIATGETLKCLKLMLQIDQLLNHESVSANDADEAKDSQEQEEEEKGHLSSLDNFEEILSKRFADFVPDRNDRLVKWYKKTKWAALNSKGAKSALKSSDEHESILTQIQNTLDNKDQLYRKCHTGLSKVKPFGTLPGERSTTTDNNDQDQEYDFEIYEDDDFYHRLLKELIQSKTTKGYGNDLDVTNRKFVLVQRLRNKMRRKVDTKASKGRRLRYEVHPKMVNFMAPVYRDYFHEEDAKDELFSSLFGGRSSDR